MTFKNDEFDLLLEGISSVFVTHELLFLQVVT